MNEGTRTHPEFSGDSISVKASGEPIKVNGHACPAVADWNHDGKWEIVLGSDIGCVGWHENIGSLKEPNFGPFQVLIPAVADQKFFVQELESGETPKPGVRTQICVADHNLDGRMDLLVGDLSKIKVKRELLEDDVAAKAKLTEDIKEISGKLKELGYADEKEEERQKLIEQLMSFMENEKAFYESARESSYVWLYLRSDSSNANVESPTDSNSSNQKITGPDNNNIWLALQYLAHPPNLWVKNSRNPLDNRVRFCALV